MFVQFYRWLITGNALCFFNKPNCNLPKGQPEAVNEKYRQNNCKKDQKDTQWSTKHYTKKLNIKQLEHN